MNSVRGSMPVVLLSASVLLAGCEVEVRENGRRHADLDVRTPIGDLTVRNDVNIDTPALPVYPGARPRRDRDEGNRGNVRITSSFFDFEMQAAQFEVSDRPADVVEFYRKELAAFGDVVECRGDIDSKGRRSRRPVCDERLFERETQLAVGTDELHRLVTVKPRAGGTEFAIVYIDTRSR